MRVTVPLVLSFWFMVAAYVVREGSRLTLNRETLRELAATELHQIAAGATFKCHSGEFC